MINLSNHHKPECRALAWLLLALVLLLASPLAAQQMKRDAEGAEKEGAKSIFYNPSNGAASRPTRKARKSPGTGTQKSQDDKVLVIRTPQVSPVTNPGLHYWFEMEGIGKVSEDRIFHTSDRLRLHLRSNINGYLTLWAYDSSGGSKLLFPSSTYSGESRALTFSENSNYVQANTDSPPNKSSWRQRPKGASPYCLRLRRKIQ